jgi:hypothetical protein
MPTKRKNTRFDSEVNTLAEIDLQKNKKFYPTITALVITESYSGCSAVLVNAPILVVGQKCLVKVGLMKEALKAEARWVIQLDEHIQKVGFQYLE